MIKLSIVIPTLNRAECLDTTLNSITIQNSDQNDFEVIVIDNGSTDNTDKVIKKYKNRILNLQYIYEKRPGLHVGRNLGLQIAKADIVSYLDDDVILNSKWIESIINRFNKNNNIVLVGGPCKPKWEGKKPYWLESFIINDGDRWELSELSLIDLGNKEKEISAMDIYGCNYSIKRKIAVQLGGFRPDGMPKKLLKYRGDGESGLSSIIDKNDNFIVFYEPLASVEHIVSSDRLTEKYFRGISKRGAIGDAYSKFRSIGIENNKQHIKELISRFIVLLKTIINYYKNKNKNKNIYSRSDYWLNAYFYCFLHYLRIFCSLKLRKWVCQDTYYNEDSCPYSE